MDTLPQSNAISISHGQLQRTAQRSKLLGQACDGRVRYLPRSSVARVFVSIGRMFQHFQGARRTQSKGYPSLLGVCPAALSRSAWFCSSRLANRTVRAQNSSTEFFRESWSIKLERQVSRGTRPLLLDQVNHIVPVVPLVKTQHTIQ